MGLSPLDSWLLELSIHTQNAILTKKKTPSQGRRHQSGWSDKNRTTFFWRLDIVLVVMCGIGRKIKCVIQVPFSCQSTRDSTWMTASLSCPDSPQSTKEHQPQSSDDALCELTILT